jgi:hypothetical protein
MLYLISNQSNDIVVTWSERCTTQLPYVAIDNYNGRCDLDGAFPAEVDCALLTYAKLLFIPTTFLLELTSIATRETTSFTIQRVSNQSDATSRYDKFTISVGSLNKGQYTYTAYEGDVALVETGLALIQMGEQAFVSATNNIEYVEYS